jgi:phosphomannomutase/phosphoglucomutase
LGVAFDGDGDRLGMVTNTGRIIWPDRQLMLFVRDVLSTSPGSQIIYDVKCTHLLDKWVQSHGGNPIMWKTGHSLIKSKMSEVDAALAGEMSGHFYFKDRWYGFDDALYAAARLLEILSATNASSEEVFSAIPDTINTPELRLPMADDKKFAFMEEFAKDAKFADGKLFSLDGVRVDWDFGFGLVRASNTSPYLILRFEANSETNLKAIQDLFRSKLLSIQPTLQMPF